MPPKQQRRSLTDSLNEDLSPEMEAFRKGEEPKRTAPVEQEPIAQIKDEPKAKMKNRKLVIELEESLYDAFATTCFTKKIKMAKLVRQWIEEYTKEN
jgi:hypothetical protein